MMSKSDGQTDRDPFQGCIIEMDTVVLNGIQQLYAIIKAEVGKLGVTIDEGHFTRYCLGIHLETGLNRLLVSFGRRSTSELAQAIRAAYLEQLGAAPIDAGHPVVALVKGLSENNVRVALLTRLSSETATERFAPMLGFKHVTSLCESQVAYAGAFPWDVWRRAALTLNMTDRLCVAVVAGAASCKAALAANMPVVAIPNEMTDFQDFTGAIACLDSLQKPVLPAILQALRVQA
jgi:beta-phosphoglucomutase-like phosphatase (HAD superfamily)